MNRSPIIRTFLICLVLVAGLTVAQSLFAQTGNLLTNPGFEKPFQAVTGSTTSMVAQGWTAWALQVGQNTEPEYYPASDTTNGMPTPRIRSGSDAQQYFTYFSPHIGGVYQTVSGVKAGDQLTFSIYAYLWVSSGSDASSSDGSGQVAFQVGIDPKGGTDATSSSIVWSTAPTTYDKYAEYSVTAAAAGSSVTVFARSSVNKVAMNNVVYLDDASLMVTGAGTEPAAASTAAAASTSAPAVATAAVVASTPVVAPPTEAATAEVSPTVLPFESTQAATAASTPMAVAPPAATQAVTAEVTQAPTAVATTATVSAPAATATAAAPTTAPATAEVTQVALVPTVATTEAATPEVTAAPSTTAEVTLPVVPTTAPSATVAPTSTLTNTATTAPTATLAATTAPTNTPTETPTSGPSSTPSNTPTASSTPGPTNTPAPSSTPTPSPTLNQTQFPYLLQYTVVRGDTVSALATRFGSTVSAIIIANQLGSNARIYETQKLVIPVEMLPQAQPPTQAPQIAPTLVPSPTFVPPTIAPTSTEMPIVVQPAASATVQGQAQTVLIVTTYVVHYGDTLSTIAARFGLTTQQLADANDIVNPNLIRLGQVLKVPQSGTATPMPTSTPVPSITSTNIPVLPTSTPIMVMPAVATPIPAQSAQPMTYQVMLGDNLYRISVRFNVPIVALIEANGIYDANRIFVGEILIIP